MQTWVSRIISALALTLALPAVVIGQPLVRDAPPPLRFDVTLHSPFIVRSWTTQDGLPDAQINSIVQTREGYLWLATYAGLARFDGLTFQLFTAGNSPGFVDDRLHALSEGADGTLWIGTESRGVFALRDGTFFTPAWNANLPDLTVLAIVQGRDGSLWVGTDAGVARLDATGERIIATYTSTNGLPEHTGVPSILEARDGTVWFGTFRQGLFRLDGDHARPAELSVGTPLYVSALAEDETRRLWIATSSGLFAASHGDVASIPLPRTAADPRIGSVRLDAQGTVWAGSTKGVCRVAGDRPAICDDADGELGSALVQMFFMDREGNVWVAPQGRGLFRFTERRVASYVPIGTEPPTFGPLVGDGADGVWAGSSCTGLWHLRGDTLERYQPAQGVPSYCIGALHRDGDGTLWMSGSREGLIRIRNGEVTVFDRAGPRINAIARDAQGVLWIGSNELEPLGRMTADENFVHYRLPVDGAAIQFITSRRAGGLWLGTTAGLFAFDGERPMRVPGAEALDGARVRSVLEDADGAVWIASHGRGLNRLKDGHLTHYAAACGLVAQELSWLVDDGEGYLWVGGTHGITRVARRELTAVADGHASTVSTIDFDESDGMPNRGVSGGNQPAASLMSDGRLWFASNAGLSAIAPRVTMNAVPPSVVITTAVVDGASTPRPEFLQLPAGTRSLEVHYAGLSFTAPQKVHYRYRLDGYDKDWVLAGPRRIAYYTGLPPGAYRFEVSARNESGVWSQANATLAVRMQPFISQTIWFRALAVAALVLVGVAAYRWRLRQMTMRATALEATVAARTSELRQANEQLAEGHRRIEKAHGDAIAFLNQTPLGVCVVDGDGRVAFINSVARRVLERDAAHALGQPWPTVLTLSPDDHRRIDTLLAEPRERRQRVPVRVARGDESHYWMEIEARDDPSDPSRRLLYLHDVTELFDLQRLLGGDGQFQGLIGETTAMRLVYRQIRDVAAADSTVIIEGETGTGKELVARAIHALSERRDHPFVAVNCAALTESILTSQLFGHRRGAFTGAVSDQVGLFEAAHRGTVLLDEIGDISPAVQASLLRVLQEREITRIGESHPRPIDVRVLAATHRSLPDEVAAGRFRQDLLYRLRVVQIRLPALRERKDDLPILVAWFLGQLRAAGQAQAYEVSREAMDLLVEHDWPGNVRELKSVIESAALTAAGSIIELTDLPGDFVVQSLRAAPSSVTLDACDREHVRLALRRTRGNRAAAARLLGISRNTLYRRLRELNLDSMSD